MPRQGRRGLDLDYHALHQRYLAGESGMAIARSLGINHAGLYASWKRRGLVMRSTSAAAALTFEQHPERKALIARATAVRKGGTDTLATREARARTREARCLGTSALEDGMAVRLDSLGIDYIRQKAIGPYNVDFAIPSMGLVIECNGGGHNPRVRANHANRVAFIETQGWRVLEVSRAAALRDDWSPI